MRDGTFPEVLYNPPTIRHKRVHRGYRKEEACIPVATRESIAAIFDYITKGKGRKENIQGSSGTSKVKETTDLL